MTKVKIVANEDARCPYCGKVNFNPMDLFDFSEDGDSTLVGIMEAECEHCGRTYRAAYKMEFMTCINPDTNDEGIDIGDEIEYED